MQIDQHAAAAPAHTPSRSLTGAEEARAQQQAQGQVLDDSHG